MTHSQGLSRSYGFELGLRWEKQKSAVRIWYRENKRIENKLSLGRLARTNLDGSATGEQVRTDYRLTFGRYQEQINLVPDSFMLLARPGGFWVLIILLGVWRPTVVLSYSLS